MKFHNPIEQQCEYSRLETDSLGASKCGAAIYSNDYSIPWFETLSAGVVRGLVSYQILDNYRIETEILQGIAPDIFEASVLANNPNPRCALHCVVVGDNALLARDAGLVNSSGRFSIARYGQTITLEVLRDLGRDVATSFFVNRAKRKASQPIRAATPCFASFNVFVAEERCFVSPDGLVYAADLDAADEILTCDRAFVRVRQIRHIQMKSERRELFRFFGGPPGLDVIACADQLLRPNLAKSPALQRSVRVAASFGFGKRFFGAIQACLKVSLDRLVRVWCNTGHLESLQNLERGYAA